ncbi:MAG TPA: serine/threonine-protein kinase, partial [Candidatus Thermoplasmatota archaeon]|nr:serine/threonine-protein kinase [Candidatus Thermoplasmatota archaeon]
RGVELAPGATVLGKYRVERELGAGGGGRAFLAQDLRMDRRIVLKKITGGDQGAVREAKAASAIEHPNVVRIYDVETLGQEAWLVMEYVDGGSLKDRIAAGGALSDAAFARVADDMLGALEAVHATGAVHRDIKPGNVLLTRDGQAKLADFGIARLVGFETTIGASASGTVQYMSPEQARGKRLTASSDLYSAAATIYEARTGQAFVEPLAGESVIEMRMRVGAGPAFEKKVQPAALRAWFSKALAAQGRFSSASEMRKALAAALRTSART